MTCLPAVSEGAGIVLAGVFAALIGVAGWLLQSTVSWFVWFYQRKAAEYERLIALRAEIASNIKFEATYADPQLIGDIIGKMRERAAANQPIAPYTVIFRENIVFDRIKPDITSLPEGVIGAVVDYYLKSGGLDATLTDQRTEHYLSLPVERAAGVWQSVQSLAKQAVEAGESALKTIETRIERFKLGQVIALGLSIAAVALFYVAATRVALAVSALPWCPTKLSWGNNGISHWFPYNSSAFCNTMHMVAAIRHV